MHTKQNVRIGDVADLPHYCIRCSNFIPNNDFEDNEFYVVLKGYNFDPKGFMCRDCIEIEGNKSDMEGISKVSKEDMTPPPVEVGEELDVEIEAVGEKGDGLAKKDGFVLFVPTTKQGDKVKVRVTRVLQRVGFAEVIA